MKPTPSGEGGMAYVAADPSESVAVTVITEGDDPRALAATAASLAAQSLQAWHWTILGQEEPGLIADARVRFVDEPVRAAAITRALSESDGQLALVDAGTVLQPTTLEKWLWHLVSDPTRDAVAGARRGNVPGEPLLFRRSYVEEVGSIDAAYALAADSRLGYVPFTGSFARGSDPDAEPHSWIAPRSFPNAWLPENRPLANVLEKVTRRLLLISPWMVLGGADKVNLDLIDHLRSVGWEVSVATTVGGHHTLLPRFAQHTPDLFPLGHFIDPIDYPRFLTYLIDSRRFDVVLVSNSELGYRLLPYLRARCPHPAYVDFCHSEAEHWNHGGYPRLSVEYQELLDLTVTASKHLRRWMGSHGADVDRIEVSYANVDADAIAPDTEARTRLRAQFDIAEDEPLLLFVGRVSEDKQPNVLAAAIRTLHDRGVRFTLVVAGDGPDLPRLRRFFRVHGLARCVRLPGEIEPDRVADFYAAADVLFVPSRSEGIALALYEAMAAGVPVVGAAVGGQAELVTPDTGVLVERGSVVEEQERYADALEPLLRDRELRVKMGRAARKRIEQEFRVEHMGARMEALLAQATRLREEAPRPTPAPGLARAVATEAIELMRPAMAWSAWGGGTNGGRRRRVSPVETYLLLQRIGGPAYRYAVARGATRLPHLRDALRRRMMGF